ncbi:DUF808 domain-containing protein [Gilvimarinus sp. SDUM040013]|uniref:DUF808 domain-containing protein n=1 Tax=Gilvimarinus gilvus TaxID=3058038 RepID=A0ABU4RZJ2_9GAMM|nr:DUF808 domain-containing protein [Gilvimarinus sp. SDUM040013]MDO3388105.1 DUF808 domain-containing protein [Gilvimarinus sp. SDUM040013]MDX6850320.1 DUF808 domain-containing protein [Gilvimarinus sp. SDUM040013]
MAGTSLLALLDDIATLLDDISIMTKVAAKKTAGVLGDDLALNAEQVTGVRAERELPVVWAVFKGSLINKVILVPAAMLISVFLPWLIIPLLMVGGCFLCFEGFEKVAHKWLHSKTEDDNEHKARLQAIAQTDVDMVAFEKQKIKGAIRTDFILSAEIITITLGAVASAALTSQVIVLCIIALGMSVTVYGLVAGIVKIDDAGLHLSQSKQPFSIKLGQLLLAFAPKLMKFLSIAGTAAMFLVGGGIIVHSLPFLHHLSESLGHSAAHYGSVAALLLSSGFNFVLGVAAGGLLVLAFTLIKPVLPQKA